MAKNLPDAAMPLPHSPKRNVRVRNPKNVDTGPDHGPMMGKAGPTMPDKPKVKP